MKYKLENKYTIAILIKILMLFLNIIESILLARYLGTHLKGEITYINSISQILFLFGTLGINATYPYFKKKEGKENILNTIMSLNLILFVIYLITSIILVFFINNVEVKYILFVLPILCYNYNVLYIYTIENPNKKNLIVLLLTILKILYLIFLTLFIKANLFLGVTTIIVIPIIENIIFTKLIKYKFSFSYLKFYKILKLVKISYLTLICNILTIANYKIDIIMLKHLNNISLSEVGIYSVGIALTEKIFIIGDAIKEVLISELSNGSSTHKIAFLSRISFSISFLIATLLCLMSKIIINILYGVEYIKASQIINITIWGAIFMIFFKLISQYNVINAKQKVNNIFLIITLFTNILLNIILMPKFGIIGVAISTSISYSINSLLFIIYFHKETKIKYKDMLLIQKDDIKVIIDIFRRDYEK